MRCSCFDPAIRMDGRSETAVPNHQRRRRSRNRDTAIRISGRADTADPSSLTAPFGVPAPERPLLRSAAKCVFHVRHRGRIARGPVAPPMTITALPRRRFQTRPAVVRLQDAVNPRRRCPIRANTPCFRRAPRRRLKRADPSGRRYPRTRVYPPESAQSPACCGLFEDLELRSR